ncbi:hypothetical protein BN128_3778 [Cronobacter sakazakii 696]|nr:hypothetical protein BN128_3778 [Cronobacter sakazakii 696]
MAHFRVSLIEPVGSMTNRIRYWVRAPNKKECVIKDGMDKSEKV